jgi:hypothetical protein
VGLRFQRVPEEDQEVDCAIDDFGSYLLVASQWTTLKLGDGEAKLTFQ